MSANKFIQIQQVNTFVSESKARGVMQLVDEATSHDGHTVTVNGIELVNFGSCGYMGLEFDPQVRQGGIDAINNYGIEFSSSRAYLANPLYEKLEELLGNIFRLPALLQPTTTLAHLSALPTIVGSNDIVLLDQQVHSSVQLAAKVLKANGIQIEIVPHSNIDKIEKKINYYKSKNGKIQYLGDGVYSMYGDLAPVEQLKQLLIKYEQFHLYLDDAHGMSWMGNHGRGFVLDKLENHERLFVVTGLAKGFGTGGGVIICPSIEQKQLIRTCGSTQIFSGPLQPPILGAAIESAKIHLRHDFFKLQKELSDRIQYCRCMLENQPLPILAATNSPIQFLGVGSTEVARDVVKLLIKDGFWLNIAQFPAVAPNHAGLRFMLTRKTTKKNIEDLVENIARAVCTVIGKDEEVLSKIWKSFK